MRVSQKLCEIKCSWYLLGRFPALAGTSSRQLPKFSHQLTVSSATHKLALDQLGRLCDLNVNVFVRGTDMVVWQLLGG